MRSLSSRWDFKIEGLWRLCSSSLRAADADGKKKKNIRRPTNLTPLTEEGQLRLHLQNLRASDPHHPSGSQSPDAPQSGVGKAKAPLTLSQVSY